MSLDGSYSTAKPRQPSSINKHQSHKAYPTPYLYIYNYQTQQPLWLPYNIYTRNPNT